MVEYASKLDVSIHAPRVGRDRTYLVSIIIQTSFNSRTPCGARPVDSDSSMVLRRFNSRTPCGARLIEHYTLDIIGCVSIHAPRVGRDLYTSIITQDINVSIHAPRVGRDDRYLLVVRLHTSFNSRTPCGARRTLSFVSAIVSGFQFTHPVWGATEFMVEYASKLDVSIHAPRVGRDAGVPNR